MKKKVICLITISILLCVPTKYSQAITFPISDAVDDVLLFPSTDPNEVGVPFYYPTVDIYGIATNDTYIHYVFIESPIIDNKHQYYLLINWDTSGENFTKCIAGNIIGEALDEDDETTSFVNGTYTMIRHSNGTQIYSEILNDAYTAENCDSLSFPINISTWITVTTAWQIFAFAGVPKDSVAYPLPVTNGDGWICDSAGSGSCLELPTDTNGTNFSIFLGLTISGFAVILVITLHRKRRK